MSARPRRIYPVDDNADVRALGRLQGATKAHAAIITIAVAGLRGELKLESLTTLPIRLFLAQIERAAELLAEEAQR